MTHIATILSGAETTERAIQQLAALNIDGLDWRVLRPEVDHERLIPGWPVGSSAAGATGQPVGAPVVADLPEGNVLEDEGVPDDEAEYYAQSLAHGATVVVIDSPAEHVDLVCRVLENVGATRISID
ncbi:MAG TPA: hypothetical protein PKE45_25160 [Caldilineaceae bacterium]|nr:hypothetical protein [Caldilineaceae bacterium]